VRSQGYESQGEAVTIAVGVDIARVNRRMNEFLWGYSALSGVMLACLALLQGWVLRRALRVLARVRAELAQVRQGAAQEVDEHVPSEIAPLVGEINQLTRAAALRLQRSRRALGNLAHALKTPLTVLRQLAQDEHLSDRPSVADALTEQVDLLRRRVDLELRRGRLAGHGGSTHRVDICAEMRALVQPIASLYRDKRLDIVCDAPAQAHFQGDREDMLELFGNLLDNACKYGEHQVRVGVREDDGVHFVFEDDGPGCAPEQFERLTRRGVRLDERVHGHGLGLAIAADIVASYSGTLEFARSGQLGGLRASVWLPFVTSPPHWPPIALNEREYSFTTKN